MRSDAEVIAVSLRDATAFTAIFDRHFAAVFRFAERRVGHDQAAEVAAEVFARAFVRRTDYRREVPDALPWLYGIASNLILRERRRFARYMVAVQRIEADAGAGSPFDDAITAVHTRLDSPDDWARMRAALMALDDTDRELLLLVVWDELSYAQAATVLNLPVGTVRSKLHRTKRRLRELLGASGRTPVDRAQWVPKEAIS